MPRKLIKRLRKRPRRVKLPMYKHLNGFPKSLTVRLKYVEPVSIPSGGSPGLTAAYSFRTNGIHDPNYSGTGYQAMNFDIYKGLYSHYTVQSSNISVAWPASTVNYCGLVRFSEQLGSTSSVLEVLSSYANIRRNCVTVGIGDGVKKSYASFNARKHITAGGNPVLDDRCLTAVTTNPTGTAPGFVLNPCVISQADTMPALNVMVEIVYVVTFTNLIQQPMN